MEFFFTPGERGDVEQLWSYDFDLPTGSRVYADKAYNDYRVEDALAVAGVQLLPMRKRNQKRQFVPWVRYIQHYYRKRVETTNSCIVRLLPKSIHAVTASGFQLKVFLFILATSIKSLPI